jgi:hypothetical protein
VSDEAISLFLSPEFGVLHEDQGIGQTYFAIDESWANRIKVAIPITVGPYLRTTFLIGRHEDCWLQFGAGKCSIKNLQTNKVSTGRPNHDSLGVSLFNVWSRVQCTLAYDRRGDTHEWVVMTGGVFIDASSPSRERVTIDDPKSGVYLNGKRLNPKDQIALFKKNQDAAFLCFGHTGKIFVKRGAVGEDSTALPSSIWRGSNWPSLEQVKLDSLNQTQKRFEIEQRILKEQQQSIKPDTPASWADVAMVLVNGPDGIDKRLWQGLLLVLGTVLAVLWVVR